MPTQTELEFYKAFDIEPLELTDCSFINIKKGLEIGIDVCPATDDETLKCENCKHSKIVHKIYPEITDRQLLELTVLANQIVNFDKNIVSVDELKDSVLDALIVSKALAKPEEASVKDTVREIMGVE